MAIYRNGELFKKNQEAEMHVPEVHKDQELNKSIEDYIILATKAVTLLDAINAITKSYSIEDQDKVRVIKEILPEDNM